MPPYTRFVVPIDNMYTHVEMLTIHRIVRRRYGLVHSMASIAVSAATVLLECLLRTFATPDSRRDRRRRRCSYTIPCKANDKRKSLAAIFLDIPLPLRRRRGAQSGFS